MDSRSTENVDDRTEAIDTLEDLSSALSTASHEVGEVEKTLRTPKVPDDLVSDSDVEDLRVAVENVDAVKSRLDELTAQLRDA
ncbi:hypothetical protein [Halegenticoccus tardaugens]|uniref:hypothetical protein n=1 Tax=Halegenticoccus tardaugens TaxID=2071624 RepID=UPI00100B6D1C|nr:hypothetical protein [Halegenticoccus tardaugens]